MYNPLPAGGSTAGKRLTLFTHLYDTEKQTIDANRDGLEALVFSGKY
jgi:hypothetical protein